jgi:hypothetical protein
MIGGLLLSTSANMPPPTDLATNGAQNRCGPSATACCQTNNLFRLLDEHTLKELCRLVSWARSLAARKS